MSRPRLCADVAAASRCSFTIGPRNRSQKVRQQAQAGPERGVKDVDARKPAYTDLRQTVQRSLSMPLSVLLENSEVLLS